jgi:tripartite-type tricarboxylate transporter receptor subunit TctC
MTSRILDPDFKYVPAKVHQAGSDYLRAKFRKMMRDQKARDRATQAEQDEKLIVLQSERRK